LEFLIKNGSERVIDDARAHTSLLKMLRQFHFIDANGKDQGLNVRNRSKELVDLLSDVDKIRTERKKAKGNRAKYGGYEGGGSGGGSGGESSSSGRYGGFGSESAGYGAYDGRVYGDGGGFGGQSSDYQDTQARRDRFEEYDEFEEGAATGKSRRKDSTSSPTSKRESKKPVPNAKVPEEDLFDFGDEAATTASTKASGSALGSLQSPVADEEDDFDDFQSAPVQSSGKMGIPPPISASTTSSQFSAPLAQPPAPFSTVSQSTSTNLASPLLSPGLSPAPSQAPQPTAYQRAQPNYFTSVQMGASKQPAPAAGRSAVSTTPGGLGKPIGSAASAKPASGDAFAGLLVGASAKKDSGAAGAKGLTMADLARQKTSAGIWGANAAAPGGAAAAAPTQQQKTGGGLDDLLGL
jgi:epsin